MNFRLATIEAEEEGEAMEVDMVVETEAQPAPENPELAKQRVLVTYLTVRCADF